MTTEIHGQKLGFLQLLFLPWDIACAWTEPAVTAGEWELESCPQRATQRFVGLLDGRERVRLYACTEHAAATLADVRLNLAVIARREELGCG